ncbi:hypothetical protein [Pseudoalteromonas arabiensis]|uniref:hypothetical protein n=1 Tax=Pseudoalteromonas arabiensis TaxID=874454 RepID=UPI0007853F87|nr:hypothetical protein [Pseudoalteromonas arabiensis]
MRKLLILIGIAIAIPLATPLFINLYITYVPGYQVGSIDGWLGFSGGFSGGFLAFISAYVLFIKQKSLSERCWLTWHIEKNCSEKESETYLSVVYMENHSSERFFDCSKRSVSQWEPYGVAIVTIKNVSKNYARKVNVELVKTIKNIKPVAHRKGEKKIGYWETLSELAPDESFDFVLHLDPKLVNDNGFITFRIESTGLSDVTNVQEKKLHFRDGNFEIGN